MASFGQLLRQLRTTAGLTQEELAHAATLSTRSVSDLERGINLTARKDTARLLADALNLEGPARVLSRRPPGGTPRSTATQRRRGHCLATSPRSPAVQLSSSR
jgi:transcriptional regulator with XRE-family HTH domain